MFCSLNIVFDYFSPDLPTIFISYPSIKFCMFNINMSSKFEKELISFVGVSAAPDGVAGVSITSNNQLLLLHSAVIQYEWISS